MSRASDPPRRWRGHEWRWPRSGEDRDDLERLNKLAKNDALDSSSLTYREWGLLYRHLPEVLPDVHPAEVRDA